MYHIDRRKGEKIRIAGGTVTVTHLGDGKVTLSFDHPRDVEIRRAEDFTENISPQVGPDLTFQPVEGSNSVK